MNYSSNPQITSQWKLQSDSQTSALRQHEDQVFLALTLFIGALVGLIVVAFILLTERLGMKLYPPASAAWRRVSLPVLGSLTMGYLTYKYFPEARGSGVPQTEAALHAREGRITLRTVVGKFFCTAATLASGIPLGREGPSVQVGAGISSVLGRRLGLSPEKAKSLLPVGAAAAVAAAFNTPIAAVLFALEELMGDLHAPILGSVVLASATSWATLHLLLGDEPLFHVPQYKLVHPMEFAIYAVLGVAGGLVSVVFTKFLLGMRERFLRAPSWTQWFHPLAGGIATGLFALLVPQVLGVGYGFVGDALNERMAVKLMAVLVVLKLLAVTISYASGNAGGIFGPSLFIGAMLGGCVGSVAHKMLPAYTASPGAYALVGMGTAFAGIIRAPMTSVMMIFETTRDYAVIVPLMISNLVSFFISRKLQRKAIYECLALQDGVHLPDPGARSHPGERRVEDLMRAAVSLPAQSTVRQAIDRLQHSQFRSLPVLDQNDLLGVVTRSTLEKAVASGAETELLKELAASFVSAHIHKDHPLHIALERLGATGLDLLPVVSRANILRLEGIVTLDDVLETYGVGSLHLAQTPSPPPGAE